MRTFALNACVFCLLLGPIGLGLGDLCRKVTKGFAVSKLETPHLEDLHPISATPETRQALNQPFRFYKKATSCYVFVSKDQRYVLKLLRSSDLHPPAWTRYGLLRALKPHKAQSLIDRRALRQKHALESYSLAMEELREVSGLIHLHLSHTTHLNTSLQLIDPLGSPIQVEADTYAFALQKKAEPFTAYFDSLKSLEEKKNLLTEFASLLFIRAQKGLRDEDLNPKHNLGILYGKIVCFDLDGIRPMGPPQGSIPIQKHMMRDALKMLLYLDKQGEELSKHLELEIYRLSLGLD